jgi:hypothetical protein
VRRAQVLSRRALVFGAAALAFLLVVVLRPSRVAEPTDVLPSTFPGFDPAAVATLRVERTTERDGKTTEHRVVLQRTEDGWRVENRGGYPAKTGEVARLLDEVRDAKTVREDTADPARAAAFAGTDGYTEVTAAGVGGKVLARFGLGKNAAGGDSDTSYLRLGEPSAPGATPRGDFRVVTADGIDPYVQVDPESWVDRDVWPALSASDVAKVEIDHREKERVVALAREKKAPPSPSEGTSDPVEPAVEEDAWRLEKPTAGPASPSAAKATVNAFTNLTLDELVDVKPDATDADFGFDRPILVVTATGHAAEGVRPSTYVLTVGKRVEKKDSHYARRATERGPEPFVFEVTRGSLGEFEHEAAHWAEKPPPKEEAAATPGETPSSPPSGEKPEDGAGEAAPGTSPAPGDGAEPAPGGGTPPGESPPPESPPAPEEGRPPPETPPEAPPEERPPE